MGEDIKEWGDIPWMSDKLKAALEETNNGLDLLGYHILDDGKRAYCECGFFSDLGEDFCFAVELGDIRELDDDDIRYRFAEDFKTYYEGFDPEVHAAEWYEAKDKVRGVPSSLRALLKDADSIDGYLSEWSAAINRAVCQ